VGGGEEGGAGSCWASQPIWLQASCCAQPQEHSQCQVYVTKSWPPLLPHPSQRLEALSLQDKIDQGWKMLFMGLQLRAHYPSEKLLGSLLLCSRKLWPPLCTRQGRGGSHLGPRAKRGGVWVAAFTRLPRGTVRTLRRLW
jgi:hypothetical protein